MSDVKKKQLVYNFIEFLRTSSNDGTVKEDDKESLEVAIQCIAESFGVDPDSSSDQTQYSIAPTSLLSLLDVYLKTKAKAAPTSASTSVPSPPTASTSTTPDRTKAESHKVKGNALMSQKLYESAIEEYSSAIKSDGANPVYYSNRAAAWGGLGEHERAVEDAEKALELDATFSKGYSRLGHAQFSLGEYQEAITAYEKGLKLDPGNANMKSALATAKVRYAEESSAAPVATSERAPQAGGMPDLSALAGLMGGMGGGAGRGGGGGMPDLASLMQNPQMMAMAQQMMANGGLERLMQNPSLRNMAENMQNGGGMPDLGQLANDPSLRDLASQFMPGQGGRGAQ